MRSKRVSVQFLLRISDKSSHFWCMAIETKVILKKINQNNRTHLVQLTSAYQLASNKLSDVKHLLSTLVIIKSSNGHGGARMFLVEWLQQHP